METLQPKLRFPEFEGDWVSKKLEEVSNIITGSTPSTSEEKYYNGEILFVSPFDINGQRYISEAKTKITELGLSKVRKVRKGSVFVVCIGSTIGKVGQAKFDCATNQQINTLQAHPTNKNDFIYSLLEKNSEKIKLMAGKQAVPLLNKSDFSRLLFNFPSLSEQTKIANFLSSVDEKINLLKEKKALLEDYKKGMMQKIFSQELRFKDDNGNDFEDWEEKSLGDIGTVLNGLTYSPDDISEEGVLVLRSSNIKDNRLKFDDNVYVNKDNFTAVIESDILICVRNGSRNLIGKNTLITKEIEGVAFGAFMSVYRSEYNRFLIHWFGSEYYYENVNLNLGATINSINGSDLKKFKVPFPNKKEQTKIATFLSAIDEKIELVNTQIEDTQEYKKGLLQQLFV